MSSWCHVFDSNAKNVLLTATGFLDVYAERSVLFYTSQSSGCSDGSTTTAYKPITPERGIIYAHNDAISGDVIMVAHVVIHPELQLVAFGNGYILGYTEHRSFVKHDEPVLTNKANRAKTFAGGLLLEDMRNSLKILFPSHKVTYYTTQLHENMRRAVAKKLALLTDLLHPDVLVEVAKAKAPSWVHEPFLEVLEKNVAWSMNGLHKDFMWNLYQVRDKTNYWCKWHVAIVPTGKWKMRAQWVMPCVYMPRFTVPEKESDDDMTSEVEFDF